jgi:hypothetical protein
MTKPVTAVDRSTTPCTVLGVLAVTGRPRRMDDSVPGEVLTIDHLADSHTKLLGGSAMTQPDE